jgi:Ca2+-binding RTX toxin-like protein
MAGIIGTSMDETLYGTAEDDRIEALDGNDAVHAGAGNDEVLGGDGRDILHGEAGDDLLEGGAGDDFLFPGTGNDMVSGGDGDDFLASSTGSDTLEGGSGDDAIHISRDTDANDIVRVWGGSGKDRVFVNSYGANTFLIDTGEGDDLIEIYSPKGTLILTFGAGSDMMRIVGSFPATGLDTITITDFDTGAAGDRLDILGVLTESLKGWDFNTNPFATGHLRLLQSGAHTLLQRDLDGGGDAFAFVTVITFSNINAQTFTYHNLDGFPADGSVPAGLSITGTADDDTLTGAAGNDTIAGLEGIDRIWGGSGDDVITGGSGMDHLSGEGGDDVLDGGDGDDALEAGFGDDVVRGGEGSDRIVSSYGGSELLQGDGGDDTFHISRSHGRSDVVTAEGGDGDDSFYLSAYGLNHVFKFDGGAGNDSITIHWLEGVADLTLGGGADVVMLKDTRSALLLYGSVIIRDFKTGAAGDTLHFDTWLVNILQGWDQVTNPFGTGHLRLVQNGSDTLLQVDADAGGTAREFRTVITFKDVAAASFAQHNLGGWLADGTDPEGLTIIGTEASETLTGTAGADRIEGRGGYDTLYGEGGNDTLIAGASHTKLYGGPGNDILHGGDGGGTLDGGAGDDTVYGGSGADWVAMGTGADTAYAGAGNDQIHFQSSDGLGKTSTAYGEAGDDHFSLRSYSPAHYIAFGGDGDDRFEVGAVAGTTTLTLGAGSDRILFALDRFSGGEGRLTVTDFAAGPGGDLIDFAQSLSDIALNWDGSTNPFTSGYLRLRQVGSATVIEVDRDAAGTAHGYLELITLSNTVASSLTAANLGFSVPAVYGTAGDDRLAGSAAGIRLEGGAGNDIYDVASLADEVIERASGGTDTVRTAAGSRSDHTQLYVLPGHVENFIGTAANGQGMRGNALANVITMAGGHDLIVLDDGGDDTVSAGGGNDFIYFGDAWTAADKVDGGAGTDTVALLGNYTITFGEGHLTGVERLALYTGQHAPGGTAHNYHVTVSDAALAAKTEFYVFAGSLKATETLVFNGSAETDARLIVIGGAGDDILAGGARPDHLGGGAGNDMLYGLGGNDVLVGGLGADLLDGGAGQDWFQYTSAAESTSTQFDTIRRFEASGDRIDLPFAVTGWTGNVTGSLSFESFDADVAAAVDQSLLGHSAVLFRPDAGTYAGRTFVVIDGNGDGVYTAGLDYLFEFTNQLDPITPGAPIFV